MPAATGVVQEAGVPLRPSISTRQRRQEPNALERVGGAELWDLDAELHRRAHDRRAFGDRDRLAVDLERHHLARCRGGRGAEVDFLDEVMASDLVLFRCGGIRARPVEILGEMLRRALCTGMGVKPPMAQSEPSVMRSQRSSSSCQIPVALDAGDDPVDDLDAARRADAAGRAFAAGFDGAEFHREARLLGHVDGIVEHHEAAMADHRLLAAKVS